MRFKQSLHSDMTEETQSMCMLSKESGVGRCRTSGIDRAGLWELPGARSTTLARRRGPTRLPRRVWCLSIFQPRTPFLSTLFSSLHQSRHAPSAFAIGAAWRAGLTPMATPRHAMVPKKLLLPVQRRLLTSNRASLASSKSVHCRQQLQSALRQSVPPTMLPR